MPNPDDSGVVGFGPDPDASPGPESSESPGPVPYLSSGPYSSVGPDSDATSDPSPEPTVSGIIRETGLSLLGQISDPPPKTNAEAISALQAHMSNPATSPAEKAIDSAKLNDLRTEGKIDDIAKDPDETAAVNAAVSASPSLYKPTISTDIIDAEVAVVEAKQVLEAPGADLKSQVVIGSLQKVQDTATKVVDDVEEAEKPIKGILDSPGADTSIPEYTELKKAYETVMGLTGQLKKAQAKLATDINAGNISAVKRDMEEIQDLESKINEEVNNEKISLIKYESAILPKPPDTPSLLGKSMANDIIKSMGLDIDISKSPKTAIDDKIKTLQAELNNSELPPLQKDKIDMEISELTDAETLLKESANPNFSKAVEMAKISNTALFDPKGDADIKSGIDSVENAIVALDLPGGLNSSAIDKAVIDAKQIDADIKDIEEQAQQNLSIPGIDKTSKEYQAVKHDYEKLSMLEKQLDEDIKKLERDRKNPNVSKEQIKKDLEKIESDIFKIAAAKQHLKTDLITLDLVYKSNPISEIKRLFYKIFKPETITVIW